MVDFHVAIVTSAGGHAATLTVMETLSIRLPGQSRPSGMMVKGRRTDPMEMIANRTLLG